MSKRNSLTDLAIDNKSQKSKWCHLDVLTTISKSHNSYPMKKIFGIVDVYAFIIIVKARQYRDLQNEFEVNFNVDLYAVESTTIDLFLTICWCAKYREYSLQNPYCMNFNFESK
jgi:hypothetical protein